jgi:cell division control protein 6
MANIFEASKKTSNIIKNEDVLNYEYVPKLLPYREGLVQEIANSIKPMLEERKGTNLFIHGAPGIGKTASMKWVLRELGEHTDDIISLYINCWSNHTKYFIFLDMANQLKLSFIQGKSAEHILQQVEYKLKDKNAVFVFDEVDKAEDSNFLYQVIERFPRCTILLASNASDYTLKIDPRIKSRLMIRSLEFKPYSLNEIFGILKERSKIALTSESIDIALLKQIANITSDKGDIRVGLFILREAAKNAENENRKKIEEKDIKHVLNQLENVKVGEEEKLNNDESIILECVKEKNGEVTGTIYDSYTKKGGNLSYRSFKRYMQRLAMLGILRIEATGAGFKGQSRRIFLK